MRIKYKQLPLLLVFISLALGVTLVVLHVLAAGTQPYLSNFQARTEDSKILLTWRGNNTASYKIEIDITGENYQKTVELKGFAREWAFTEGTHGERYSIEIQLKQADTYVGERISASRMFLDKSKLPDLPIVQIETAGAKEPDCDYVTAPEGMWGMSISNNEYISAIVSVSDQGSITANCTGEIRVRGNTSAYFGKKPFKLKLDRKVDLLNRGDGSLAQEDWVLLPAERNLATETAMLTGKLCGLSWLPEYMPVNVMVNGDWRGCYILMESVTVGDNKIPVGKTGFVVENNAYWWKDGEIFFKTEHQAKQLVFTFRYPNPTKLKQDEIERICSYMNACEAAILEEGDRYTEYIDVDSFASWLLTHDIMGTYDAGGSNMFLYKYDLYSSDSQGSKLKMGPVWDFTSAFATKDDWSSIHTQSLLHFDSLTNKQSFMQAYQEKWDQMSETMTDDVINDLQTYVHARNDGLQKSMELDAICWQVTPVDLNQSLADVQLWMSERSAWMDQMLSQEQ